MSIWRWLLELLHLDGYRSRSGESKLSPEVAALLAGEPEWREKLLKAETERNHLRMKDGLLRQALERLEKEAIGVTDAGILERAASDLVYHRRERQGLLQQIGLWESLRTQIQTLLLSIAQVRVILQQGVSPALIAGLTAELQRLQSVARETEAALEMLGETSSQSLTPDAEVQREVTMQMEKAAQPAAPSLAADAEQPQGETA